MLSSSQAPDSTGNFNTSHLLRPIILQSQNPTNPNSHSITFFGGVGGKSERFVKR